MIAEMASPVATLCSGLTSEPLAVQSHCHIALTGGLARPPHPARSRAGFYFELLAAWSWLSWPG